jgi:hypothetical protein
MLKNVQTVLKDLKTVKSRNLKTNVWPPLLRRIAESERLTAGAYQVLHH